MIQRCTNQKLKHYRYYGGRGITVDEVWRASFVEFFAHIGPAPSLAHSVDRIENDGNYEPGNVHWATPAEQARNKRQPTLPIRRPGAIIGHCSRCGGNFHNRKTCDRYQEYLRTVEYLGELNSSED